MKQDGIKKTVIEKYALKMRKEISDTRDEKGATTTKNHRVLILTSMNEMNDF